MIHILLGVLYLVLAPVIGGLLDGVDRKLTARMQRRIGPPILQPFYDVAKLIKKQNIVTNRLQNPFIISHLVFAAFTGFLFFEGTDILLIVFVLTVSSIFLILAAYSSNSPYSYLGAERELLLTMAYEPMVLVALVGFFKVAHSFHFYSIVTSGKPMLLYLPGIFLGIFFILGIKLRKSPFDISYSHHAHQELVKGITTDFTGKTLAMQEIAHWYETVYILGFVYIFFSFTPVLGVVLTLFVYFLEVVIDNVTARLKWEIILKSTWVVTFVFGFLNLIPFYLVTVR